MPVGITIEAVEAQPTEEEGDDNPQDGLQGRMNLHSTGTPIRHVTKPKAQHHAPRVHSIALNKLYYFSIANVISF